MTNTTKFLNSILEIKFSILCLYTNYPRKLFMSLVYSLLQHPKLFNTWFLPDISDLLLSQYQNLYSKLLTALLNKSQIKREAISFLQSYRTRHALYV